MNEEVLRRQLLAQLHGGQAYIPIEKALREFPASLAGRKPQDVSHTPWELLEHMRIAQWDIWQFTVNPDHVTPPWPDEHWPSTASPATDSQWHASVARFLGELDEVKKLAQDPQVDLFAPIPHGTGQTTLREILLVADHNAYHLGQLMLLRRALGG